MVIHHHKKTEPSSARFFIYKYLLFKLHHTHAIGFGILFLDDGGLIRGGAAFAMTTVDALDVFIEIGGEYLNLHDDIDFFARWASDASQELPLWASGLIAHLKPPDCQ